MVATPKKNSKKTAKKTIKKVARKTAKKTASKKEKLIGEVVHYYSNIKVAVVELSSVLKVGDEIRIKGGEVDFTQTVGSMEADHKKIKTGKKGESIGMKVAQKIREGYKVYKI